VRHAADAHRQLADMDGPHAEICRTIAQKLEKEIADADETTETSGPVHRSNGD